MPRYAMLAFWLGIHLAGHLAFASGIIPIEVWKQIYDELPKKSQKQLLLLNQEWHQVISNLTRSLRIRAPYFSTLPLKTLDLNSILSPLANLRALYVNTDFDYSLHESISRLTQLHRLGVHIHGMLGNKDKELTVLSSLTNLRQLDLSNRNLKPVNTLDFFKKSNPLTVFFLHYPVHSQQGTFSTKKVNPP